MSPQTRSSTTTALAASPVPPGGAYSSGNLPE